MSKSRLHWADMGEATFVGGVWLLFAVHRFFGRLPFRLCLYPVVFMYWLLRGTARRASLDYLQRVQASTGAIGAAPGWRESLRHFYCFAETLLDKLLALSGHYPLEKLRRVGGDMMLDHIARKHGGIIVTAHMGCLELCRIGAEQLTPIKLNVLVHTRHAERFNRMLRRLNPRAEVNLIQVSEMGPATALLLAEKIAAGEFIAIAGDRVPLRSGKTASATFLGAPAEFPIGPYVLAALLKCPLFLLGCVHEGNGYVVQFEKLAEQIVLPRKSREQALTQYVNDYAARLERILARAPYDWFNFYPFWAAPAPADK